MEVAKSRPSWTFRSQPIRTVPRRRNTISISGWTASTWCRLPSTVWCPICGWCTTMIQEDRSIHPECRLASQGGENLRRLNGSIQPKVPMERTSSTWLMPWLGMATSEEFPCLELRMISERVPVSSMVLKLLMEFTRYYFCLFRWRCGIQKPNEKSGWAGLRKQQQNCCDFDCSRSGRAKAVAFPAWAIPRVEGQTREANGVSERSLGWNRTIDQNLYCWRWFRIVVHRTEHHWKHGEDIPVAG